jgi:hypothetical protein
VWTTGARVDGRVHGAVQCRLRGRQLASDAVCGNAAVGQRDVDQVGRVETAQVDAPRRNRWAC